MELSPKQQAIDLIKNSSKILILISRPEGDSLGAAVALKLTLEKLEKSATIVCHQAVPKNFSFLPQADKLEKDLAAAKNFIISIDISQKPVEKLGYKIEGNKLNIIVSPKAKEISQNQISFKEGSLEFDLICILDTSSLEPLGNLYQQNLEIFNNIPIINLDHHSGNNFFGKINLVDTSATSTSEILISIIESLGGEKSLFDVDISTALLAGVIADTDNFQNANTTPKSLTVAAQLVASGGKRQDIIENLYKTKSLSVLRLWGRVLASIREDKDNKFVWSQVSLRDLEQSGVEGDDAVRVMDQFLTSVPEAEIIILLIEEEKGVLGFIRTNQSVSADQVAKIFQGQGDSNQAIFTIKAPGLGTAEREVIEKIRQFQTSRKI